MYGSYIFGILYQLGIMRLWGSRLMKIMFDINKLKEFLETLGCDCCSTFYTIEDNKIVDKWTSYINGVWKDHKDIILEGEIIESSQMDIWNMVALFSSSINNNNNNRDELNGM